MAKFSYEAVDKAGRPQNGSIDAATEDEVRAKLKGKGLFPTNITSRASKRSAAQSQKSSAPERKRAMAIGGVKSTDLTIFTRQFATLIDAGLPMVRTLSIVEQMLAPGVLRNAVMDLRDEVEQGSSISEAMGKNPKVFDELYVSMIRAGESSGLMGRILSRLADFREKSDKLKKQIIGALIYPAAIMTIAGAILSLIIIFIIPKFKAMFDDMKIEMPVMTQMLLTTADIFVNYWYMLPLVPGTIVVTFLGVRATKAGKYYTDFASLFLPIFGTIIKKSNISRFCRTLGELSQAGVPILESLQILRTAIPNAVVTAAVEDIQASIKEGESIAEPMRRNGVFDIMVVNMVEVGEETGELDKMLIKVADNFDNDVDTLVASMMHLLEPFMIIGMGVTVGFIVISLFLPMISVIQNMG